MVANLIHYKGHAHVLRAFGELLPRYPTLTLLLAGEGPEERRLRDLASALGLGSQVIFLGSHPDVPGLLRASDISLLYSDQEGFSNAILESMAAGLPVVASNVGGNPEAVADGVTGVIVPAAQPQALATALRPLLDNPTLATTMGARGRERAAREFSMPAMIRNLERAYETVLAERAE
jgi:glycosyltransferase involved in cell wall biosynthesis